MRFFHHILDASFNSMMRQYARDNELSSLDVAYIRQDEILMPFTTLLARVRHNINVR